MRYIFNENIYPFVPGDVVVFASIDAMFAYLEPWIADEPHLVLSETGVCYRIERSNGDKLSLKETGKTFTHAEVAAFIAYAGDAR